LDANLNRAREALRVMEDCARFVLCDGELAAGMKDARHGVRGIIDAMPEACRCVEAWRDTPSDVGTRITADAERHRGTIREVAVAAGKRAGEALRVIEECVKVGVGKVGGADVGGTAKALRYRVYELERRLVIALGTGRARQWRLCVLATEALCAGRSWVVVAWSALVGGAECVQLREKGLGDGELLRRATRMAAMCREHGAASVINDRPDIAMLAGADGVHVGQEDLTVAAVRRVVGMSLLVGVSTTNMEQAMLAARDGADVCGVGPMFATTTKHKPVIAGAGYLRQYVGEPATARVPHLAIGGITPENVGELVAAGCRGVAVSSVVCGAGDVAGVCRELLARMPVCEGKKEDTGQKPGAT
jgi:thiamine-phosphate pyrophosphorylase